MTIQEATVRRMRELCWSKGMSDYALMSRTNMPPSTIKSILSGKSRNPGIVNIWRITIGLQISIPDFFSAEIFEDLNE